MFIRGYALPIARKMSDRSTIPPTQPPPIPPAVGCSRYSDVKQPTEVRPCTRELPIKIPHRRQGPLQQLAPRLLQQPLQRPQKVRSRRPVHHSVVRAQRHRHDEGVPHPGSPRRAATLQASGSFPMFQPAPLRAVNRCTDFTKSPRPNGRARLHPSRGLPAARLRRNQVESVLHIHPNFVCNQLGNGA